MIKPSTQPGGRLLDGTIAVFAAEALVLPTGLLIVAILTRRLGPAGYGLFALSATLVAWIEWTITASLARPTVKFIGEAGEWREVAAPVLWVHAVLSGTCAGAVWLLATPIATALGEPRLAAYLRLFAVDIPIFSLAHAHRHILVGLGGFSASPASSHGLAKRHCLRADLRTGCDLDDARLAPRREAHRDHASCGRGVFIAWGDREGRIDQRVCSPE